MATSTVSIKLGGKTRHLRYTMYALDQIEKRLGALDRLDVNSQGIGTLQTLLWAGLLHEDRDLEEYDVGNWVDAENLEEVTAAVEAAIDQQFGGGNAKKATAARKPGTGKK